MLQSKAGKSITTQLENLHKNNIAIFKQKEEELKSKETSIVSQKNVMSKEEFEKKINLLREDANKYRIERRDKIDSLTKSFRGLVFLSKASKILIPLKVPPIILIYLLF